MPLSLPEGGPQKIPAVSYAAWGTGDWKKFRRNGESGPKREEKAQFGEVTALKSAKQPLAGALGGQEATTMGTFKPQA